ncbi:MAG: FkbM family methyltransferase [Gemmatimonadota bacterium]|nr:FkbM family methyltransferase [Gemmatimonadota bacterium]
MTEDPFSDASAWGRCRPSGPGGFWLRVARFFPGGWPWSRFALLARRLARRRLSGPVDTRLWGLRLRLHPDRSVSEARILFMPRSWDRIERRLLREWIEPGFTFVDVGANVGAYSFWVLSLVGEEGRVVAVEPDPPLARQLRYNVRINGAGERMRVVEAAVSASRGEGTLLLASRNSGENRLVGEGEGDVAAPPNSAVPVRVITLADLVAEAGLDGIDCLKVDVEGREGDVIRPYIDGVPRSRWPRRMIVELAHRPTGRESGPEELESWITGRGYRLVRRTKLNGVFTLT